MRLSGMFLAIVAGALAWFSAASAFAQAAPATIVQMHVDAAKPVGPLRPVWRFFGADEPNYATMKDGRKLLSELGELRFGDVHFRAHNLLNSGDGTPSFKWGSTNIYTEGRNGRPLYEWSVADRIIDTYLARGIRPYLEIGFMPEALSSAPARTPYQHDWRPGFGSESLRGGWSYPPTDYAKWSELIYQWTRHNVERYGAREVERWYFEVWNEPNLDIYWRGTPEEFYKLHDFTIDAVRRALPTARVGGPDVAGSGGAFMDGFVAHVVHGHNYANGETGTPTDFLSFHAKGSPVFVDGHIRMGIAAQLKTVDEGFAKIAAVPELASRPIVIGESDPEGCAACPGGQNTYRNGTMYSSYTAESFADIWELAERRKVNLDGVLTWAFTFEDQPYFAGYRQLATDGIDLPVLNVFRMFARLGPERVAATSSAQLPLDAVVSQGVREAPDVGVLATRTPGGKISIIVWNYHDDDLAGPDVAVHLIISGLGAAVSRKMTEWRVDGNHGNSFAAWKAIGAPQTLTLDQYKQLEAAAAMKPESAIVPVSHAQAAIDFALPRQGVMLIEIE